MKIAILREEQKDYFLDMDPLMMLERLEFPNTFALAATETNAQTTEELPAGLMICSLQSDSLIIEWLYVASQYRTQGIGEQLLLTAFQMAEQNQLSTVCAYINQEFGREQICSGEETFFKDRLFTEEQQLPGEWITDLRTLSEQPYFKQQPDSLPSVTPLQQMTRAKAREAIASLAALEQASMLYPAADQRAVFDEELCFLLISGGEVCGGILVQCISRHLYEISDDTIVNSEKQNVLYPVLFATNSALEETALLSSVMEAASKKYEPDTEIHIILRNDAYAGLMHAIMPENNPKSKLLIANVADYSDWDALKDQSYLL